MHKWTFYQNLCPTKSKLILLFWTRNFFNPLNEQDNRLARWRRLTLEREVDACQKHPGCGSCFNLSLKTRQIRTIMILMRMSSNAFVSEQVLAIQFLVDLNCTVNTVRRNFTTLPLIKKKLKDGKDNRPNYALSFLFYTVLAEDSCLSRFMAWFQNPMEFSIGEVFAS